MKLCGASTTNKKPVPVRKTCKFVMSTIAVIFNFRIFWYVDIVFTSVLHISVVFLNCHQNYLYHYAIPVCASVSGDNIIVQ